MLCGLQLPGANNQQAAFKGKVADIDQSKVWPAGTCLGIDPPPTSRSTFRSTAARRTRWRSPARSTWPRSSPARCPPEPDQDGFIKDACTKMTDAYLAPVKLRTTTLTLIYPTLSLPSWSAGSREVACSIGATLGNGGWATLVEQRQGPAADQRSAAGAAARHSRGTADAAADSGCRRRPAPAPGAANQPAHRGEPRRAISTSRSRAGRDAAAGAGRQAPATAGTAGPPPARRRTRRRRPARHPRRRHRPRPRRRHRRPPPGRLAGGRADGSAAVRRAGRPTRST